MRKRLQLRLASLFVIMAVVGLILTGVSHVHRELNRRAEHMAAVQGLHLIKVRYWSSPSWHDWFEEHSLEEISDIHARDFTEEDLRLLVGLEGLRRVTLGDSQITDDGLLRYVATLPRLQHLIIESPLVTKEGCLRFRQARPDVRLAADGRGELRFYYNRGTGGA